MSSVRMESMESEEGEAEKSSCGVVSGMKILPPLDESAWSCRPIGRALARKLSARKARAFEEENGNKVENEERPVCCPNRREMGETPW